MAQWLACTHLTRNERAGGASIEFDTTTVLVLPGNEMAEMLSKLSSLMTPNEIRNTYMNLPDVEGGDVLRVPVNVAPIDRWAMGDIKATPTPAPEPTTESAP